VRRTGIRGAPRRRGRGRLQQQTEGQAHGGNGAANEGLIASIARAALRQSLALRPQTARQQVQGNDIEVVDPTEG
jgi:hypothetical protein